MYNGEIYNYLEIRGELKALGWAFRSENDTEILLWAYEQGEPTCLERFMEMYAFAGYARGKPGELAWQETLCHSVLITDAYKQVTRRPST